MTIIDSIHQTQRTSARIAGISYLVALVTANFAEIYVPSKLIVSNDAARTAANIAMCSESCEARRPKDCLAERLRTA